MTKECLWYNGEMGSYELLELDVVGMHREEIAVKAWNLLKKKYLFDEEDKSKVMQTLYLIDIDALERVV